MAMPIIPASSCRELKRKTKEAPLPKQYDLISSQLLAREINHWRIKRNEQGLRRVKTLISRGADPCLCEKTKELAGSAIHDAAQRGMARIVRFFVRQRGLVCLYTPCRHRWSPLIYASVGYGSERIRKKPDRQRWKTVMAMVQLMLDGVDSCLDYESPLPTPPDQRLISFSAVGVEKESKVENPTLNPLMLIYQLVQSGSISKALSRSRWESIPSNVIAKTAVIHHYMCVAHECWHPRDEDLDSFQQAVALNAKKCNQKHRRHAVNMIKVHLSSDVSLMVVDYLPYIPLPVIEARHMENTWNTNPAYYLPSTANNFL